MNMNEVVKCLEARFGPVDLCPEGAYTKIFVAGASLTFPEAEKLCLGKTTMEELKKTRA